MGFGRKQSALAQLVPDIAIIPECGNALDFPVGCSTWVGSLPNKGLAVVSYGDYRVTLSRTHDPDITEAAPVRVRGPHSFFVLGLWARRHPRTTVSRSDYPAQLERALFRYRRQLRSHPAIVAGDFNHFPDMSRPGRDGFKSIGRTLDDLGLVSAYHKYHGLELGDEGHATHYWLYRPNSGFHYDYCFIPREWRIRSVRVGSYDQWVASGLSDHVPMTVDVTPR